ncbi:MULTISPECIES: LysR substrate-binding domain-containing protein [unclassified Hyphomicrobium]|uniref:LysR substrate-binding domain-containing protein n=1 Tax=unclassified Hyphomicrobium TaxID=2619925 RepID=UPI000213D40C|nr:MULTISPECIES: LysR substrate-binding domain-containing protein [unclassified Hyphomicrobium]CCB68060.1 Hydrogen peroxide-inducible genes activator [Hyphomicrobium sp. MC1]
MTLRELEYLVALAKYRHFGRAAEACQVSQPTLSAQIKKLEDELGVALVERDSRGVILTSYGHETATRARQILVEIQQLKESVRQNRNPEAGTVRLGIFPTLGPYLLPHLVPRTRKRFPDLELLLIEEKSSNLLSRLRDGEIDAAILALPINDSQLRTEFLFEERFLLAVSTSHPLARRNSIGIDELVDHDLMLLEDGHCLRDHALEVCQFAGANERSSFQATSLETLRQMVSADVGITLLPELATLNQSALSSSIHLLTFSDSEPSRQIAMCWRKSSAREPLFLSLAELFKTCANQVLQRPAVSQTRGQSRPAARRKIAS